MSKKEEAMNKMGILPVNKLLLSMGMPMIISMMLQAVYNIVDSYFVSCMKDTPGVLERGEKAVNALTLAFPVQMLMVAIGVGTGVGINALLAKSLGEGNRKKASKVAGNAIFLGLCTFAVFLIFGILGVKAYLRAQTADSAVLNMGYSYLSICTILSFGIIMYTIYEKLLQATGRTVLTTIAQVAGAGVNIVLDPVLIFGIGIFPEMGIEGAAYATVIGQTVSFLLDALFHYVYNKDIDTSLRYIKPEKKIIGEIYAVGAPAVVMQAFMSFMTYGVNIIFYSVSDAAVTAYGIYYKIQQFVFFAAFGMNNAIIPVVSFNYGKGDGKRINQGIRYGMIYTLLIMGIGVICLQLFTYQLAGIFVLTDETRKLCIRAIRIITLGYIFAGANITYQGVFQALGKGIHSLILSLLRLLVIALPLAYLFSKAANASRLIWFAFPIAEGVAMLVGILIMRRIRKTEIESCMN